MEAKFVVFDGDRCIVFTDDSDLPELVQGFHIKPDDEFTLGASIDYCYALSILRSSWKDIEFDSHRIWRNYRVYWSCTFR